MATIKLINTLDTHDLFFKAREHEIKLFDKLFPGGKDISVKEKMLRLKNMLNPTDEKLYNEINDSINDIEKNFSRALPSYIDSFGIDNLLNVYNDKQNAVENYEIKGFQIELNMGPVIKAWAEDFAKNKNWKINKISSTSNTNTNRYDYYIEFVDENGNIISLDNMGIRYEVKSNLNHFHVAGMSFGDNGPEQYKILNSLRDKIKERLSDFVEEQEKLPNGNVTHTITVYISRDEIEEWSNELFNYKFKDNYPFFVSNKNIKLCSEILEGLSGNEMTIFDSGVSLRNGYTLDVWDDTSYERRKFVEDIQKDMKKGSLDLWYGKRK